LLPAKIPYFHYCYQTEHLGNIKYKLTANLAISRCIMAIIYVDDSSAVPNYGFPSPSGTSWATAIPDLQTAIFFAQPGDEIWVAKGTYKTRPYRTDSFQLKNGVAIYGGFAGTETVRSQRNWAVNSTILSGDINGDDSFNPALNTITNQTDNNYTVVTGSNTDSTAILDGFTITAGNGSNGGGMYNYNGSPTVANVIFKENNASNGGGMYNESGSNPMLANVTFRNNQAFQGGGIYNSFNSNPTLNNLAFIGNKANFVGGMYNRNSSNPTLTNVTFADNTGGAFYNEFDSNPTIRNSVIDGWIAGPATIEYSISPYLNSANGNINADPLLVDPAAGNARLQANSPAINAGNNAFLPAGITADLGGNPRIVNSNIDMGAYEYNSPLVITEIMYAPASSPSNNWQWIEIYNRSGETVNPVAYVLDDDDGVPLTGPNISFRDIPPGGTAILYNPATSVANFTAAWGPEVNLVPVLNWPSLEAGDKIGLWDSFASYGSRDFNTALNTVDFSLPGFPVNNNSASIYLTDLSADNSVGSNWAASSVGGITPVFTGYQSKAAGGNSGLDIGSPQTPPTIITLSPGDPIYREPPDSLFPAFNSFFPGIAGFEATVTDSDSPNFNGGTLTVDISAGGTPEDRLIVGGAPGIWLDGRIVSYNGPQIGTYKGGIGEPLVVNFNQNATVEAVQAVVQSIGYSNFSNDLDTGSRTVRFVLSDGDGNTSLPATKDIAIEGFNHPPLVGKQFVIYDGSLNTLPQDQQWSYQGWPLPAISGGVTNLNGTDSYSAGMFSYNFNQYNSGNYLPPLDRNRGYTVSFTAQILSESTSPYVANADRNNDGKRDIAGFSVVVTGSDGKGIELGFTGDRIWALEDGKTQRYLNLTPDQQYPHYTLFTQAESAAWNTANFTTYDLTILGDTYTLSSDNNTILRGNLREYVASIYGSPFYNYSYGYYYQTNSISLGDNASEAGANINLSSVAVTPHNYSPYGYYDPYYQYISPSTLLPKVDENADLPIIGLQAIDLDDRGSDYFVNLSVEQGTLTINSSDLQVLDNGTNYVRFKGSLDRINATLSAPNAVIYRSKEVSYAAADRLTFTVGEFPGYYPGSVGIPIQINAIADVPNLTVSDRSGSEDADIPLNINSSLADTDGSEYLEVEISGVPEGAILSAGTSLGGGIWRLNQTQLTDLKVRPPANSDADFTLNVKAKATENSNWTEGSSPILPLKVTVNAIADAPTVTASSLGGIVNSSIALNITPNLVDTDASESISSILISGVSATATLSAGSNNGGGNWTLNPAQLLGLTLTSTAGGTIDLNVAATSEETASGDTATTNPAANLSVAVSEPGAFNFRDVAYSVAENAATATITVTRTGNANVAASVNYSTSNGSAIAGSDYISTAGNLEFAIGETSKTFSVMIVDDSSLEGDETVNLSLNSPTNSASLGSQSTAVLTVIDGETTSPGIFNFSSATYSANEGGVAVTITVIRTGGSNTEAAVSYSTSDKTANAGTDYTAASGTLNFGIGETSKTFTISIAEDGLAEGSEIVNLILNSATNGASLGTVSQAVLAVLDGPPAPTPTPTETPTPTPTETPTPIPTETPTPIPTETPTPIPTETPTPIPTETPTPILTETPTPIPTPTPTETPTPTPTPTETPTPTPTETPTPTPTETPTPIPTPTETPTPTPTETPTPTPTPTETPTPTPTETPTPTPTETPTPTPTETPMPTPARPVDADCICNTISRPNFDRADRVDNVIYGTDNNESQIGTSQNDAFYGGNHRNTCYAQEGDDNIFGGIFSDLLSGNAGRDLINGYSGDDILWGGRGNDIIIGSQGEDLILGNRGNDSIDGSEDNDLIYGNENADFIDGNTGDDFLSGGKDSDLILGGEGSDTLTGNSGDDTLCGGEGSDLLTGDRGSDLIDGCEGNDTIYGGQENDTLTGGSGSDFLSGDFGSDSLIGGSGSDVFVLGIGSDSDVIADFRSGQDLLQLAAGITFEQLTITQNNRAAVISFGSQVLATLIEVEVNSIAARDFLQAL
jgi:Ca2+-binding RTX toxin-like protein